MGSGRTRRVRGSVAPFVHALALILLGVVLALPMMGCAVYDASLLGMDSGADGRTDGGTAPDARAPDSGPRTVCGGDGVCASIEVLSPALSGTTDVDRSDERLTVGVPLPASAQVRDPQELGLVGATVAQFRALARHPTGEVAWVLLDTVTDLPRGGSARLELVRGAGDFGGPSLAEETDELIRVTAGGAVFEIRRDRFDLFSVRTDGEARTDGPGEIYLTSQGEDYLASRDTARSVVLEENGPAKAVVRVRGRLIDTRGHSLGYTARLYFSARRAEVRLDLTVSNASEDELEFLSYDAIGVRIRVPPSGALPVEFGAASGEVWSGSLDASEQASWVQQYRPDDPHASTQLMTVYGWPGCQPPVAGDRCLPVTDGADGGGCRRPTSERCPAACGDCEDYSFRLIPDAGAEGLRVVIAGVERRSTPNQDAASYVRIGSPTAPLTIVQRWMAQLYPAGLQVSGDGEVDIALRSADTAVPAQVLAWGAHITRSVMLSFEDTSPVAVQASIDRPLVGRAELAHYRAARAFRGFEGVVSLSEAEPYAVVAGTSYTRDEVQFRVDRRVHWRRNYYASERALFNFWRGGPAASVMQMWARSEHEADAAIVHSDGFDLSSRTDIRGMLTDEPGTNPYDGGHQLSRHLLYTYLTTGDERMREAIIDYGEDLLEQLARGEFGFPETVFYRAWLRRFQNLLWLYEFTDDPRFLAELREGVDSLLDTRADGSWGRHGRDLDRGFIYRFSVDTYAERLGVAPAGDHPRLMHSFFGAEISGDVYFELMTSMRSGRWSYRLEELEDAVLGQAYFLWREAGTVDGEFRWTGADYCIDDVDDADPRLLGLCSNHPSPLASFVDEGMYSFSSYAQHIYDMTGDRAALLDARRAFESKVVWTSSAEELSTLREQGVIDILLRHTAPRYAYRPLEISVQAHGGGDYTVSWTVPGEALGYRFKASDREIVDWLGFDQRSRTFEFDPVDYVAWFAADPLDAVDVAAAGTTQSVEVHYGSGTDAHFDFRYASGAPRGEP